MRWVAWTGTGTGAQVHREQLVHGVQLEAQALPPLFDGSGERGPPAADPVHAAAEAEQQPERCGLQQRDAEHEPGRREEHGPGRGAQPVLVGRDVVPAGLPQPEGQ